MRIAAGLLILCGLAACATFAPAAADKLADATVKYCEREPYDYRRTYRDSLNGRMPAGHAVHVHCPGDPDHAEH